MNELDAARRAARDAEERLTSVVATLRALYAAEARSVRPRLHLDDPCPAWDYVHELERLLQVGLYDGADPWRWVGPPGPGEAVDPDRSVDGATDGDPDPDLTSLARLVTTCCVVPGPVELTSGAHVDHYVDLRRATLHHAAAPLVGRLLRRLTMDWTYQAVGGLTLGADAVACALLHAAAAAGEALDAFVVRKNAKEHGMTRRVEGVEVTGRRVLAVEDTATTGGSVLTAVDALTEAGARVVGVVAVVDRGAGAREAIEARGLPYRYLLDLADLGLRRT